MWTRSLRTGASASDRRSACRPPRNGPASSCPGAGGRPGPATRSGSPRGAARAGGAARCPGAGAPRRPWRPRGRAPSRSGADPAAPSVGAARSPARPWPGPPGRSGAVWWSGLGAPPLPRRGTGGPTSRPLPADVGRRCRGRDRPALLDHPDGDRLARMNRQPRTAMLTHEAPLPVRGLDTSNRRAGTSICQRCLWEVELGAWMRRYSRIPRNSSE
jgi:hypothetical protein